MSDAAEDPLKASKNVLFGLIAVTALLWIAPTLMDLDAPGPIENTTTNDIADKIGEVGDAMGAIVNEVVTIAKYVALLGTVITLAILKVRVPRVR